MNSESLVSIIIPVYNREKYIKRAITSALSQTYQDIEIIIIDDGSTDRTKEVVQPYLKDKRIHYFYQENQGESGARNKAIKVSKGKYIAILDSDDFWLNPRKLEKQVNFLKRNPDYSVIGGGMVRIDKNNREIGRYLYPERDEDIRKAMLFSCPFAHGTTVFEKSACEQVGGYAGGHNKATGDLSVDWDLWLKLGRFGKFYNFQEYFLYYLQGEQNQSNYNTLRNLKFNIKLRKKYKKDYPNYRRAMLLGWIYYFYFFLPFKRYLHPVFSKIRKLIFGNPVYRTFKPQKKRLSLS